jgi:demethylmenaquinone methyltransferase/2-methoxy-6-polyprenyl-1,4-benzoquinol methylase
MSDPAAVRSMFARIARRYDLLNRLLSGGVDQRWRRATVREAGALEGRVALDLCCGTGDLSVLLAAAGARVVGVDFTPEMLRLAAPKRAPGAGGLFVQGDALAVPVASASVDVVTIAFGLRNLADRARGLAEMARVLRPGGKALVLEFSLPSGALVGRLYRAYFTRALPALGRVVSGDSEAYSYLPRTVLGWPSPEDLSRELGAAGLVECGFRRLWRGIACLHWGRRPLGRGEASA